MPLYQWTIRPTPLPEELSTLGDLRPLIATILWHRGVRTADEVTKFLQPEYDVQLPDPFRYGHMREAVDRVLEAIQKKERIMVHGDYDADGVTSTTILVETLRALGATVDWFVPDRFTEGYGLRRETVERFAAAGTNLLITIDCGTTNVDEVRRARELGMAVIIMDHHQPAATRPEGIMLNPSMPEETYPFRGHSSAGVAYTFARAILRATENGASTGTPLNLGWEKWLLDLVAISTVADLMPLNGENRLLVHYGLRVLRKTRRPGLRALLSRIGASGTAVTEQTIGFHIGPRLNAAGRLRHASAAVRLLLTQDRDEAERLVEELEQINGDRQRLTSAATDEAWEQIQHSDASAPAYAVYAPHWSPGVLGLVAGRLAEKVWKPVIVMTDLDGHIIGSARSAAGIDLMGILPKGAHFFARFGGHPGASGFTLAGQDHRAFGEWFVEMLRGTAPAEVGKPLMVDASASISELDEELLTGIDRLAPFGIDHPRPIFQINGARCVQKSFAGLDQKHLRVTATQDGRSRNLIGFRLGSLSPLVAVGEPFDAVVEPSWNTWNGRTDVQLRIIDIRSSP